MDLAAPGPARPLAPRWSRLLPALLLVVLAAVLLGRADVGARDQLAFAAATGWTVLLPGTLIHRALRGRPRTLVADLALGFATGLVWQVAVFVLLSATGRSGWQGLAPWLVLAVCLVVPPARRALDLSRYPQVVGRPSAWVAAVALATGLLVCSRSAWAVWDLPPAALAWYPDMYWYLGGLAELMREVPPHVAQVDQGIFRYHWFSTAYMAGLAQVSGVAPEVVLVRLWMVPVMAALVGLCLALAQRVSTRSWPGAVAALVITSGAQVPTSSWWNAPGLDPMIIPSPSHLYAVLYLLLILDLLVVLVRGGRLRGGWVLLLAAVVAAGGAKSSVPPTLVGATTLVLLERLVRRRPWRRALTGVGLAILSVLAALPLTSDGSSGSGTQLLATLGATLPWSLRFGGVDLATFHDPVVQHLTSPGGPLLALLLLLTYVVRVAWALPGLTLLRRDDPAPWLLLGAVGAATAATFVIVHDGLSQVYFLRGVLPVAALLGAWGAVEPVERALERGRRGALVGAALGALTGAAVVRAAQAVSPVPVTGPGATEAVGRSLAVAGGAVLLAAALWVWVPRARVAVAVAPVSAVLAPAWASLGAVPRVLPVLDVTAGAWSAGVLVLGALALLVAGSRGRSAWWPAAAGSLAVVLVGAGALQGWEGARAAAPGSGDRLTRSQVETAAWAAEHVPSGELGATNVHCLPNAPTAAGCDARGFWASGLTRHRMLVDGWAYTPQARERTGTDHLGSRRQPFHDPGLLALNDRAFTDPDPQTLAALRARGVTWLFASRRAGVVSPRLAQLAELVHETPDALVYRLR